ncbi:hypothetical protein [Caballeronia sp. S22]|uniref:hypothetical protein n=1 Tax=Caballeronia sp. S22 TaxID=3137182 RepID=UPI003530E732
MYDHIWSTFALADGTGMVTYPCSWDDEDGELFMEPKLGIETLRVFEDFDFRDI